MKYFFLFALILVTVSMTKGTEPARKIHSTERRQVLLKPPSMLSFGQDEIIKPFSPEHQQHVRISTAFNGWIYASFTTDDGSGGSGYAVMMSRDHGLNWDTLILNFTTDTVFTAADIIICGTDTTTFHLYFETCGYIPATGNHVFFVDKYQGNTGVAFLRMAEENTGSDSIYDVAIASDYLHPAAADPNLFYSVEAVYTRHSSGQDSLIAYQSLHSGGGSVTRTAVDGSSSLFGKVSVSYGVSAPQGHPNGRYFIAYEEHSPGSAEGHIKETGTLDDVNGPFVSFEYLDSLNSAWINHGKNPSICIQNSVLDNDSDGLSGVVAWESNINGSGNLDAVGAYCFDVVSNPWHSCWLDNSPISNTKQPDISYDESVNRFVATYWDSTGNSLVYKTQGFNFPSPTLWILASARYNDQVGTLTDPFPRVVIDPVYAQADFAWSEIRNTFQTALFDAENAPVSVSENVPAILQLFPAYPDPAADFTNLAYQLTANGTVIINLYDLFGKKISCLINNAETAGYHQLKIDARGMLSGCYIYSMEAGSKKVYGRLVVTH